MKSGTYYLLGLIILSLVFMASNSSAQPSIPSPYSNILIQRALPPPPVGWSFPSNSFAQPSIPSPYSTTIQRALPSSPAGGSLQGGYSRPTASVWDTGAAGTMISSQLRTPQGDYLAEISDLVIDPVDGRVSDVIITGIRGMGKLWSFRLTLCQKPVKPSSSLTLLKGSANSEGSPLSALGFLPLLRTSKASGELYKQRIDSVPL